MKRGRPFKPDNKFGLGRPLGSRNKQTQTEQKLLDEYGMALVRKSLAMALQGDVPLLRMFLDRKLPKAAGSAVKIGRLPTGTMEEVAQAHQSVINEVASGNLNPGQAVQIDSLLEMSRKVIATEELVKRVQALELRTQEPGRLAELRDIGIAERLQTGRQRASQAQPPAPDERLTNL